MYDNNILVDIILVVIFIITAGYYYIQNKYSYWSNKGLKGPKPLWPLGNFHKIVFSDRLKLELKWYKEFGKVYGIYRGIEPHLVVCDYELIQQITIKDFDSFTDHEGLDYFNKYQRSFIFFAKGDHWKRIRALMSPTFTSGKIKKMFKFLDSCSNDLIDSFKEQLKETKHVGLERSSSLEATVDVKDLYHLYTMDAITNCCYGIKMKRDSKMKDTKSGQSRNEFVDLTKKAFSFSIARFIIGAIVPIKILSFFNFELTREKDMKPMADYIQQLIAKRRGLKDKNFDDYLQSLIDARLDDEMELNDYDSKENHHANLTYDSLIHEQMKMVNHIKVQNNIAASGAANDDDDDDDDVIKQKTSNSSNHHISLLSDLEIISGGMFLLFVGLDTTAILLSQCTYALAFHQDEQAKLHNELGKIAKLSNNEWSFDYDELTSSQYLDSVIAETLRLFPPFPVTNRVATKDYYIDKLNLKITKGTVVHLNNYVLMNTTEYWIEPSKFNPNRFMPGEKENIKQGTYCPFGIGPRHCAGMRFSLTEAKLAIAKLVMSFQFLPVDGLKFPAEPSLSSFMVKPKKPLVKFVPRK